MKIVHGGDIYTYSENHKGQTPLDLSSNINPFGVTSGIKQAMQKSLEDCDKYPDPFCRKLRKSIATMEKIDENNIYCGNGAADVLFRFSQAINPKKVLITAPTFAEYEKSLPSAQIKFHELSEKEDFSVTNRILDDITVDLDAVYICNPNNPTGKLVDGKLLNAIAQKCHANNIWLMIDECFIDFIENKTENTLKNLIKDIPKLVLLRAFTKMFAVAGVRLGYCISSNIELIEKLYAVGQTWNVSVIAQACGCSACLEHEFVDKTVNSLTIERKFLINSLKELKFKVIDSDANFVLIYCEDENLDKKLEKQGILIRNCSNYRGLKQGYYRIAVKLRENTQKLIEMLKIIEIGE